MNGHAIYSGYTWHQRHVPVQHGFRYNIHLFWLDLDELESLDNIRLMGYQRRAPIRFRRQDYLDQPQRSLKDVVLDKVEAESDVRPSGKVFFLGQLRWFGLLFSPVNFYYCQNSHGDFTHLLAEVSNTPWLKTHCYVVDMQQPQPTDKAFHVSPFNPMDMQYQWTVPTPEDTLKLIIDVHKQQRHFTAGIQLQRQVMNSKRLWRVMVSTMSIKTVAGIYWQALKLFTKRAPIYSHPASREE